MTGCFCELPSRLSTGSPGPHSLLPNRLLLGCFSFHVPQFAWNTTAGTRRLLVQRLQSGVMRACRYEPGIQRTYADMARHFGTVIVPARPKKPRDKAKVEVGVLIAQRWILARLRNQTFFSLESLNARIAELREDLNRRPMRKLSGATRRELYERYDRPALRALPSTAYQIREWDKVRVNLDYHVEIEKHWYSAPYVLVHEELWSCSTSTTVELFANFQPHGAT